MKVIYYFSFLILFNQCTNKVKINHNAKSIKILNIEKEISKSIQIETKNDTILFLPEIDTIYKNNIGFFSIQYKNNLDWIEKLKFKTKNIFLVRSFDVDSLKSEISIDFVEHNEFAIINNIEYNFKRNIILKLIYKKDSLVNNMIDSMPCINLTKKYFNNGKIKSKKCGTNYRGLASGQAPVGLYSRYDSLGNLKQTVFYHVNTIDKAYKIITEYDNGKITSKIKTKNDELYEIIADTLEVIIK